MKKTTLLSLLLILFALTTTAQRNPNTNAGKISKLPAGNTSSTRDSLDSFKADSLQNSSNNANNFDGKSVQLGAALCFSLPTTNIDKTLNTGYGFAFKLGFNTLSKIESPVNLYAGLGFDYLYFGGDKSYLSNNASLAINSNSYGWYPYVDLELGRDWPFKVFGTAYYGARFFYTRQNINYTDGTGQSRTDTKNIEGDITRIYGIGGGVKLQIVKNVLFELRYHRNYGNVIKVIDPQSIKFNSSTGTLESYQNFNADSDLNIFYFGIMLSF